MHGKRANPLAVPRQLLFTEPKYEGDEGIIPELEEVLLAAEANCDAQGTCTLPETQHLQIRVIYFKIGRFFF